MTANHDDYSQSEEESIFPDLPPELKIHRRDGTGPLTAGDLYEMREAGQTGPLNESEGQRAKEAAAHLKMKMGAVTIEFNEGRINQAQFQAIYTRYGEQLSLIQHLLNEKPLPDVWQHILEEGSTNVLRKEYAAKVVGCVLCYNMTGDIMQVMGRFNLTDELLAPLLSDLSTQSSRNLEGGQRCTQIEGGRWLCIVPGVYSTTIVLYSSEPSSDQLDAAIGLQAEFEEANLAVLKTGVIEGRDFSYPQQGLFVDEE